MFFFIFSYGCCTNVWERQQFQELKMCPRPCYERHKNDIYLTTVRRLQEMLPKSLVLGELVQGIWPGFFCRKELHNSNMVIVSMPKWYIITTPRLQFERSFWKRYRKWRFVRINWSYYVCSLLYTSVRIRLGQRITKKKTCLSFSAHRAPLIFSNFWKNM